MEGNAARTVASTNMNAESSRSHAVFNVVLTQTVVDVASGVSGAKVNWILIFINSNVGFFIFLIKLLIKIFLNY